MQRIAIIGAGLSGLLLARELAGLAEVTVFEKARGPGGRMATRYADPYQFDHGAQFFIAKTQAFKHFLTPLIKQGLVARWEAEFVEYEGSAIVSGRKWGEEPEHFVPVPKMNAVCKFLSSGQPISLQTRVEKIEKEGAKWKLTDDNNAALGDFDWVISTAPAEQTAALLPAEFEHMPLVKNTHMQGCYSVMLGFEQPLDLPWQAALIRKADISWISVNSSKPGRDMPYALLVHATNKWADAHLEDDLEQSKTYLMSEVARVTGMDVSHAVHQTIHKWRYANIAKQKHRNHSMLDSENKLAACGDWCIQGRVEAAFTSAMDLANKLKEQL